MRAGTAFPAFRYRVERAKVAEFARAIGDELRALPAGDMEVPVGFLFFVTAQDSAAVFRDMGLGWSDVLLGGVSLRYQRPLRVGEELRGATCAGEVRQRGDVAFVSLETRYADEGGAVPLVEVSTIVVRRRPAAHASRAPDRAHPAGPGGGLRHVLTASRMAIAWMAVAIEDPNPVHVDDEIARLAGLPSAIAHGTFPVGATGAMLTRAFGAGSVRSLDLRLTAPTYPGDTVTAVGARGSEDGALDVVVHAGDRVVARGRAEVVAP